MKKLSVIICIFLCLAATVSFAKKKDSYRFVIIPKVVHPWFNLVYVGAQDSARMLEEWSGTKFIIEYLPPKKADVAEQNRILKNVISSNPDGIMIDLLDQKKNRANIEKALAKGIKIIVFDSVPPPGIEVTSVGNDFCEQAMLASERLVKLLNGKGEVAIMMGVPDAPNHKIRAQCHEEVFKKHPGIKLVAKGIDYDDIRIAREQASDIIKKHPNLKGWVSCDAAGPIGIAWAVKKAGKIGEIISVGTDDLPQLIKFINEGVVESSFSTKPRMQGYWSILALWQATLGRNMPKRIDTGIVIITKEVTKNYKGL